MSASNLALLVLALLLAALAGALLSYLRSLRIIGPLRGENARLTAELDAERRARREQSAAHEQARSQLADTFSALASDALKHNSSEFLKLAQENLKGFQQQAQNELAQREKAVETLVKPIREVMEKTEVQIRRMEKERQEAYGSLSKHLETMAEAHRLLLKRLAELAGMVEHCDFVEQAHVRTEDGAIRPDMVVSLPDGRDIVVDAKTPLDAYLSAVEASDDEARAAALQRHARKVRERVRELAAKSYWQQFANAPDFVVLFIPGDQFLSAALDLDRSLLEDALASKVILATPTSFVALLRAVAYGWRQEQLAENAEKIRSVGEEMYGRLVTFAEHLTRLGKSLDSSVGHFNKAVGSFDTRILPGARKFSEMGISANKEVPELDQVEHAPRSVESTDTGPAPAE
ncbi:MAG: DNA recombination protein RmuC [Gammaproteobacteria bacterium]